MRRAQKRDAVLTEKFWFRNIIEGEKAEHDDDSYSEMSINEIMNGNETTKFPGIIPLVRQYIEEINPDLDTFTKLEKYLGEVSDRASGKKKTNARSVRDLVMAHPDYKFDSVVGDEINYDITKWYLEKQ